MANYASKLIKVAEAEVGYLEKASNSNLDNKTGNAGSGNFTKYARDLAKISGFYNGNKNGYHWCDVFVDWCFVQAFGVDEAKKLINHGQYGAGCTWSSKYFRDVNRYYQSPTVGDVIFFGSKGEEYHTGIVYKVDSKKVYTIEGNTSGDSGVVANGGGVFKKSYSLTSANIAGYGRPNYDTESVEKPAEEPVVASKSLDTLVEEVMAGLWGNGTERKTKLKAAGYDCNRVQEAVNSFVKTGKTLTQLAKEVIDGKYGNGSARKNKLKNIGASPSLVQDRVNELLKQ